MLRDIIHLLNSFKGYQYNIVRHLLLLMDLILEKQSTVAASKSFADVVGNTSSPATIPLKQPGSKQSMYSIGSTLGAPMKLDATTLMLVRPNVARMCIEMDLRKKIPNRIWICCGSYGFWQKMNYEKVPKYCSKCLKQGHDIRE